MTILCSSLHWSISLLFCAFSYNGVCYLPLKLSVSDVIVSQKGFNGEEKLYFFGRDYKYTPLYKKDIKQNHNRPMETTCVSRKLRLLRCKVGAPLVLRLVSIKRLSHHVDLFNIGVDSIRLLVLRYYSMYVQYSTVQFLYSSNTIGTLRKKLTGRVILILKS